MRVLVCGDRNWCGGRAIQRELINVMESLQEGEYAIVIEGEASRGTANMISQARKVGVEVRVFEA